MFGFTNLFRQIDRSCSSTASGVSGIERVAPMKFSNIPELLGSSIFLYEWNDDMLFNARNKQWGVVAGVSSLQVVSVKMSLGEGVCLTDNRTFTDFQCEHSHITAPSYISLISTSGSEISLQYL